MNFSENDTETLVASLRFGYQLSENVSSRISFEYKDVEYKNNADRKTETENIVFGLGYKINPRLGLEAFYRLRDHQSENRPYEASVYGIKLGYDLPI